MLDTPVLIKNIEDIQRLTETLQSVDIEYKFSGPDTRWVLHTITNVEFYVTPQKFFVSGCKDFILPRSVALQHNNILGMTQGKNWNSFDDNLCFFHCLAQCLVGNFEDSSTILSYFSTYCKVRRINITSNDFCGVPYTDLELLEDLFQMDIQVFSIAESKLATC